MLEAGDGLEALGRLGQEEVDVMIADLRMPRMSGVELHERLQAVRPTLAERVLVKPELAELERRLTEFVRESAKQDPAC